MLPLAHVRDLLVVTNGKFDFKCTSEQRDFARVKHGRTVPQRPDGPIKSVLKITLGEAFFSRCDAEIGTATH